MTVCSVVVRVEGPGVHSFWFPLWRYSHLTMRMLAFHMSVSTFVDMDAGKPELKHPALRFIFSGSILTITTYVVSLSSPNRPPHPQCCNIDWIKFVLQNLWLEKSLKIKTNLFCEFCLSKFNGTSVWRNLRWLKSALRAATHLLVDSFFSRDSIWQCSHGRPGILLCRTDCYQTCVSPPACVSQMLR